MKKQILMRLVYYDMKARIRLENYADTVVYDNAGNENTLCAVRFGGYPESVSAMTRVITGGGTIILESEDKNILLKTADRRYNIRQNHSGVYAEAAVVIQNEVRETITRDDGEEAKNEVRENRKSKRQNYIFYDSNDGNALFEAVDRITEVPLISEYRDYVLKELENRKYLRPLKVISVSRQFEARVLICTRNDENIVSIVEDGLKSGEITIPGAARGVSALDNVVSVTGYLNEFGVFIAERIRQQFIPLFDPEKDPLSEEILKINESVKEKAGYSLYDAQLAVAEAIRRQLLREKSGLIIAECGSGKTKIGMAAMSAAAMSVQKNRSGKSDKKAFNIVLCPSHMAKKWVREIKETLPDTDAAVIRSIKDFDSLFRKYENSGKDCYAVISKERARDGYMRVPAARFSKVSRGFECPSCGGIVKMTVGTAADRYEVNADQFFFKSETGKNHRCAYCGSPLWTALNPNACEKSEWVKIGEYGFVHRYMAREHLNKVNSAGIEQKIAEAADNPDGRFPVAGAYRSFPLSTYIKKKYKGRVYGLIVDELHQYSQNSGQGDAMAELYRTARKVVGMTATLINGYSSGMFYLLYRTASRLMILDGKKYGSLSEFSEEYGVVQNTYIISEPDYNSNRRTSKRKVSTRQLPGVSPLVYTKFLLEKAAFLSLDDMGKDLPEYEEIPVALSMPEKVAASYTALESELKSVLKRDKRTASKILSAYVNLLTAYPDQPYGHDPIIDPFTGSPLITPQDVSGFDKYGLKM